MKQQLEQSKMNPRTTGQTILLIAGILLIAFNLRPAITSVGPVIGSIRSDLHLSNGLAGFLTTLPLLSFALLSPIAPKVAKRLGNERTLWLGLAVLLFGIVIRSFGSITFLMIGTALVGVGIAICNVLLPGLVKHKFPAHAGLMTSVYTTSMSVFAALASGVSVPLSQAMPGGWNTSFLVWGGITLIAMMVWAPQLLHQNTKVTRNVSITEQPIWRSRVAWQVTFFMGLQSFLFYSSIAWFPDILASHGMNVSTAGWMLSIMQFAGLPSTFLAPVLAEKLKTQRPIVFGIIVVYLLGMIGLLIGGSTPILVISVLLTGIGQGASISLALTLIGLRTRHMEQAAALSGMAQSLGYLLAAVGPLLIGVLFDMTHSWTPSIIIFIVVLFFMFISGMLAGRNVYISDAS
ncbi:CynX/NimT family MFS transporter [Bacillus sp. 179-C3.3 HS]|uniref:CynX/NimT family MFS transporter n=1 Tax=Bacillus sp. 179-C3.3 HS TaxID=3232162 RepID=UPI0039A00F64